MNKLTAVSAAILLGSLHFPAHAGKIDDYYKEVDKIGEDPQFGGSKPYIGRKDDDEEDDDDDDKKSGADGGYMANPVDGPAPGLDPYAKANGLPKDVIDKKAPMKENIQKKLQGGITN